MTAARAQRPDTDPRHGPGPGAESGPEPSAPPPEPEPSTSEELDVEGPNESAPGHNPETGEDRPYAAAKAARRTDSTTLRGQVSSIPGEDT